MLHPSAPARIRHDRPRLLPLAIAAAAVAIWALLALGSAAPATAGIEASCFPGTASRTGKQPCGACPAGSFASGSGATSCDLCPIGSFAAGSGNTACQPCPAGTYADEAGSAICVRDQVSWPSTAEHCGNGDELETCIAQGIRDGGIVEIAANDIAAQSVDVTGKGFTLRPQPGFTPTFGAGTAIIARGGESDVEVVIEGLVIESGFIEARQAGPHRFEATIRDNEIQRSSNFAIGANSLLASGAGPAFFRVEDNRITIDRSQTFSSSVTGIQGSFTASDGVNDLVVCSNTIEQRNTGQAGAIAISNLAGSLTLDVIGNRIDGADFNNGVRIVESAAATTSGLIANNAVSGQVSAGGVEGAIGARLDGSGSDLAIVNNSVAFNESGIRIGPNSESVDVSIANNLIAFNEIGLFIQAAGVANDSNLVFDNGSDFFTPGPGTVVADPLFVPDDLALGALSPARDAGNDAFVPAELLTDLAGNPRIVGSSVDIGAFEVPEPATGLGVAVLAALAALRRRAGRHAANRRWIARLAIALALASLLLLPPAPATAGIEASCFPGTASRTGKQPCGACPAGSFASGSGATSCDLCPIGSFAAGSGNTACQPCPNGTYADLEGSAICVRDQVSWPSSDVFCQNPNDLEICVVQAIRDGGIVEVAADAVPAQDVLVTGKGFTLRPQPGRVPVFGAGTTIRVLGDEADMEVVIEGLVIERGFIDARQDGPHRFEATIRGNEIREPAGLRAIEVGSDVPSNAGPTSFRIEDNRITNDQSQTASSDIAIVASFLSAGAENELVIRGNEIVQRNTGEAAAIVVSNTRGTLTLDVIGNLIDGEDFNNGVAFVESPDAATNGLVANNVVSGQVSNSGVTGAIGVRLDGSGSDLAIVNNTVAFNESGVRIDGLSESIDAVVANNVIAFNELGLVIPDEGVVNESNLVFDNGIDFFTPGPGTIAADPLFDLKGLLSIRAASPARDAGDDAFVPLDLLTDVAGNPRIAGASVDIGAFEVPEPATGLGVAALATVAALRRHARVYAYRRS